jgi:hypothetical protein
MTTTTAPTRRQPDAQRLTLAGRMLDRSGLALRVDRDRAALALARAFEVHHVGSAHAALLGAALSSRRGPEDARPLAEQLVRQLVSRGEPPYMRALQGELQRHLAAEAGKVNRRARHDQRLGPLLGQLGPRAAEIVGMHWRQGRALTPSQLARALNLHTRDAWPLAAKLAEAGWLELHQCHHPPTQRLKPGPRATEPTRKSGPRAPDPRPRPKRADTGGRLPKASHCLCPASPFCGPRDWLSCRSDCVTCRPMRDPGPPPRPIEALDPSSGDE